VLVFDDKLVDMLRVIDQQVRVEVFGNIGIKVEQVGARRVSTPTLIATSVNVVEHLGIAFQETGKPAPKTPFISKGGSNGVDEDELTQLEKNMKAMEEKRLKGKGVPTLGSDDEELPF
jgi:hypothetical protein